MTFPQPSSVAPVLGGQQSFRLFTPLASAGDIYESEVSALAFSMGPNSDIARVQVSYLDAGVEGGVGQAIISPDRTLVGRIDARNDTTYPGGRRGRILISPLDVYNPQWRPTDFDDDKDRIEFISPYIDVIQYFVTAPSVVPPRSDKSWRFQYPQQPIDAVNGVTYIVIPAYGRKSGYFTFKNIGNGSTTVRAFVLGVQYGESADPGPDGAVQAQVMANSDLLADGDSDEFQFKASEHGLWDALVIGLGGGAAGFGYPGGPFPMTATLSDDPQ